MIEFTQEDLIQMEQRGSVPTAVAEQFQHFEKGFNFADLQGAATVGDGITRIAKEECETLISRYDELKRGKKLLKFVPASGAASRMFKDVYGYMEGSTDEIFYKAQKLLVNLPRYAFYEDLKKAMAEDGLRIESEINKGDHQLVLSYLLTERGLNYGNKPKAVLRFHRYEEESRTALEEHLVEGAQYARGEDGTCHIHFTVSEQHLPLFQQLIEAVKGKYEARFGVKYDITLSTQSAGTDTLAATEDGEPFRDSQGLLLFRPGGHGALIENMNRLRADVIFVKNIDNVFREDELQDTILYKKLLAAKLITLQERAFSYLNRLEAADAISEEEMNEIIHFVEEDLQMRFGAKRPTREELIEKMNRPMRVCGMVRNEGEPGGGPFWVRNSRGETSLQIVESSQIDKGDKAQMEIMRGATHFNPVDMVCSFRKRDGGYFDLQRYVDPETGFISRKSYEGRNLQAMELPGLWNGAMAEWITLFVEVPLSTFHPVKTMFDLQR